MPSKGPSLDAAELPRRRLSRAEQHEAKHRLLLTAALEVLAEKGYQAMTLEEVAERAGFSRRPIYTAFGSKERLALAVFERLLLQFTEQVVTTPPARTLAGTIRTYVRTFTEFTSSEAYRPILDLQLELNQIAMHDDDTRQRLAEFIDMQHERTVQWLEQMTAATGQGFRLPVDMVARLVFSGIAGITQLSAIDPNYRAGDLAYELLMSLIADRPSGAAAPTKSPAARRRARIGEHAPPGSTHR